MKKILSMVLVSVLVLAACSSPAAPAQPAAPGQAEGGGQAAPDRVYNWRFGLVNSPTDPNFLAAQRFVDYLDELAPGRWNIELFPSSQLGTADEMLQSLQMGALELTAPPSSSLANFASEFGVWDMPYMIRDGAHADAVLDGEIGQSFIDYAAQANVRLVGWWEVGFRAIANNVRPIYSPEDVAGLRLRVINNEFFIALFGELGADPVPMSLSEAYIAIQNGTIDGKDNPPESLINNATHEVARYIAISRHVYTPLPVSMSMNAWNSMPEEDQAIFMEAMERATEWQRNARREGDVEAINRLEAYGNVVTWPDQDAFQEQMQPVWDTFPQFTDIIERIVAT